MVSLSNHQPPDRASFDKLRMSGKNGYQDERENGYDERGNGYQDERENGYDERENGYDERGNGYDEREKWLRGDFAIVLRLLGRPLPIAGVTYYTARGVGDITYARRAVQIPRWQS